MTCNLVIRYNNVIIDNMYLILYLIYYFYLFQHVFNVSYQCPRKWLTGPDLNEGQKPFWKKHIILFALSFLVLTFFLKTRTNRYRTDFITRLSTIWKKKIEKSNV